MVSQQQQSVTIYIIHHLVQMAIMEQIYYMNGMLLGIIPLFIVIMQIHLCIYL